MLPIIKLYTTTGCHLCEEAELMLLYLIGKEQSFANIQVQKIEIAENDRLVELYGIRIPVLSKLENELGWPFSLDELHAWLISKQ